MLRFARCHQAIIGETGVDMSKPAKVVIGRDTRKSGPGLIEAARHGLEYVSLMNPACMYAFFQLALSLLLLLLLLLLFL